MEVEVMDPLIDEETGTGKGQTTPVDGGAAGPRLYNSRLLATYLELFRIQYPNIDIDGLLAFSGTNRSEVEDKYYWFTQEQVDRFHEKAMEMTGNRDIAREAGRYGASSKALGIVKAYALEMVNAQVLSAILEKGGNNLVKSCRYEARKTGPNQVTITVTPQPGTQEKIYQCENRIGFFEGAFASFSHTMASVIHEECMFKGGSVCRYVVSWPLSTIHSRRRTRNLATLLFLAFNGLLACHTPPTVWLSSAVLMVVTVFFLSQAIWREEREALLLEVSKLRVSADSFFEDADKSRSLVASLETETITDPLIGIYNRRYADRRLSQELARIRGRAGSLSVLMIDVDHFKRVNDVYGHHVGDLALRHLGHLIQEVVRRSDVAARYGGEEILVIAPDTHQSAAEALGERIRRHVESNPLRPDTEGIDEILITVSIGIASLERSILHGPDLVCHADEALYRAKSDGRNRVAIYKEGSVE
jgi:diguanylate cyclase (GGDEF)-like protein